MKKSAFTLIELLVVISIIAILAGIALPVFNKVMEKSRATSCASNLKQLGLGVAAYLNDNDETMFTTDTKNGPPVIWPTTLHEKYVQNWKVFRSPFDKKEKDQRGNFELASKAAVSYGINENILKHEGKWDGNWSKLYSPSKLILMAPKMDPGTTSEPTWSGLGSENVSLTKPTAAVTKPPYSGTHNSRNQINVLFADTHVSSLIYNGGTSEGFSYVTAETTSDGSTIIYHWDPLVK